MSMKYKLISVTYLTPKQGETVYDYCLYYHCNGAVWKVKADVCLCYSNAIIKKKFDLLTNALPPCCKDTYLFKLNKPKQNYECPLELSER